MPELPSTFYSEISAMVPAIVAAVLGGVIGAEREWREKPAGLRTHMLVAMSAALVVVLGPPLVALYANGAPPEMMRNEPLSILHAIILGISFIGAGVVFKDANAGEIRNLTTAATLLFAGTIGILSGCRLYYLAGGSTLFMLAMTIVFGKLERREE